MIYIFFFTDSKYFFCNFQIFDEPQMTNFNVVVCGNQKTGKSTLVQQLSGVDLINFIDDGKHTLCTSTYQASFANINIIDTAATNNLDHVGKTELAQVLHKADLVLLLIESLQFESKDTISLLSFIISFTTCPIIVLVNKIDQILSHCIGSSENQTKQSFKTILHQKTKINLKVISNPIEKLNKYQTLFACTMCTLKEFLIDYQLPDTEVSRVQIVSSMLSHNILDLRMMDLLYESLSVSDKHTFSEYIWTLENVVKVIMDLYEQNKEVFL